MDPMTLIALGSLALGAYNSFKGGSDKSKPEQLPTKNPQQMELFDQLINALKGSQGGQQNAMGLLQQYMNPESDVYKNFEAPYLQKFNQETIPQLADQFAGFGANSGALSSSGFGQALGAAGANLQTNLAGMKSGMQRNAINDYLNNFMQMLSSGLGTDTFAYHQQDKGGGFGPGFGAGASNGINALLASLMNQGGNMSNGGYQAKNPLSNTYGDMFKTGYADYMGL